MRKNNNFNNLKYVQKCLKNNVWSLEGESMKMPKTTQFDRHNFIYFIFFQQGESQQETG